MLRKRETIVTPKRTVCYFLSDITILYTIRQYAQSNLGPPASISLCRKLDAVYLRQRRVTGRNCPCHVAGKLTIFLFGKHFLIPTPQQYRLQNIRICTYAYHVFRFKFFFFFFQKRVLLVVYFTSHKKYTINSVFKGTENARNFYASGPISGRKFNVSSVVRFQFCKHACIFFTLNI